MKILRNVLISAVMVLTLGAVAAFAQEPVYKTVHFNVNVPYTLRTSEYTLPAGNYVLHQMLPDNLSLFALYKGKNMMHAPIAMIFTAPIYYNSLYADNTTKMLYRIDEESEDSHPVIGGWNVAGEDGWQIISVVPGHKLRSTLAEAKQPARQDTTKG